MKRIFKLVCVLLALLAIDVPILANGWDQTSLGFFSLIQPEQFSFSCHELIDDFETDLTLWRPYDDCNIRQSEDCVCGAYGMKITGTDKLGAFAGFDKFNVSSAKSIMLACKTSCDGVITLSDGDGYSVSGEISGGKWFTVTSDIRNRDSSVLQSIDISFECDGEGILYVDYVCTSNTVAPSDQKKFLTDEYTASKADVEFQQDIITLSTYGRDCTLETGRIDTLLDESTNALTFTADNRAECTKIVLYYADAGQGYSSARSVSAEMAQGLNTYVFSLDGVESVCRFEFEFQGKPDGEILIYNIALSCNISGGDTAECYVGDDGKISFKGPQAENGACYLYKALPNGTADLSQPIAVNEDGSGEFTFDSAGNNGQSRLFYSYTSVYYDEDGNGVTLCPPTFVQGAEKTAQFNKYVKPVTEKFAFGSSFDASGVFLPIDADIAVSTEKTEYFYEYCGEKYYISNDVISMLDVLVPRLYAHGKAVYLQYEWYYSMAGIYDEASAIKLYALTAFLTQRYNGEDCVLNGFVVGNGGNITDKSVYSASVQCAAALYTVNAAAKSVNGGSKIIFPVRYDGDVDYKSVLNTILPVCPFVDGVMFVTEKGKNTEEFCKYISVRTQCEAFVLSVGYGDDEYGKAAVDFYKCIFGGADAFAVESAFAEKMGGIFTHMDERSAKNLFGNVYPELFDIDGYDSTHFNHNTKLERTLDVKYGLVHENGNMVYSPSDNGGKWLCGEGCTSVANDGDGYIALSFDVRELKKGSAVLFPNANIKGEGKILEVHMKADYLGTDEGVPITVSAECAGVTVSGTSFVQGQRDVTVMLDLDKVRSYDEIDRIYVGVQDGITPRLCVYGIYLSTQTEHEHTLPAETERSEQTDPDTDDVKKENDKTSVAAAVSVTAFMLICLAVTVIVIDTRKGGVLTNRFKNMFIKRK